MCIQMVVLITWLSFKGQDVFIPQWAATSMYYLMIACMVFMIKDIQKEQNTIRIRRLKTGDEEQVVYEVNGQDFTEDEIILWIVKKMDVDEKEAKILVKKISEREENK